MGKPEIEDFLSHLVMKRNVASTQNQAFNAILFLYTHVLNRGGKGVKSPLYFWGLIMRTGPSHCHLTLAL